MPVARYFLYVGGVLLALLFVVNAIMPQEAVVPGQSQTISSPGVDKTMVRIRSTQKLPERVVYDTSQPIIVPAQVNAVAAAVPPATGDASAQARVRNTFAQFIPEKADAQKAVAEAKPADQRAQAQPQAPKKHKVARYHAHPQQPMRLAQPGMYQPYRVAQQQPRMGFFGGFGTW
ncbi:hypothetical protein [Bradyrhizobium sp. NAS96.2]|uniref:hypothetical protein n=1 Tax=Bradyrhizobium sp. NAS96.2 TaxID=1680160 RepID=UPI00093F6905|nr:hypothetical protein [Bradyrhizobium sp. NAS96.2]OKO82327.1 hypothetical protein AC628_04540 [Bradyrhizobium sp. NAS96.2]